MPDYNKYAANVPDIRPEIPKTGLSLIVQPVVDYVNRVPPVANFDAGGTSDNLPIPQLQGISNIYAGTGQVPISPAAATDYNTAARYNSTDLLFLPTRDNEDLYAKDQGFFKSVGNGLGRLVLTTGTKLGTGIGYTAGLAGLGNSNELKDGTGFSDWVSGAADNGLAQWFQNLENNSIKRDWLPIYQEAADRNKGFFKRAATDLNFWTEDFTDGAAFMVGAFVPGMVFSKLGAGAEAVSALAKARGLTQVGEATALSEAGLSGAVESEAALARGATVAGAPEGVAANAIEGNSADLSTKYAKTIQTTQGGLHEIPRVLSWIDNAKLARNIDVGATTIVNTGSEAMFEADGVKKDLINKLTQVKNPDGTNKYTTEEIKRLSAKAARDTFIMNLGALSASNLWEANLFFKKVPGAARALSAEGKTVNGLFSDVNLQKKTFGQKLWDTGKGIGEGVLAEGLWEENIQLAIQRLNESDESFDLDFTGKLAGVGNQYLKQTGAAISGTDTEAASNIGIGGLMGGGAEVLLSGKSRDAQAVVDLNKQVSFFKTIGNIYESNEDGKIKLDNAGNPTVDVNKLKAYTASMNKVLGLQEVGRNLENRSIDELAQVFKDETFARYAKAHFDNGLGELLHQRLDNMNNISSDDLIMLGYDPASKNASVPNAIDAYKKKAIELEDLYDNIQKNYLPARNDKKGKKFYALTDKIFYLSSRAQSLAAQIANTKNQYDNVQQSTDSIDNAFNSESDSTVNGYNEKYEALRAAQRGSEVAHKQQNYLYEANTPSNQTLSRRSSTNNPNGLNSVTGNYIEESEGRVIKAQKELNDYITSNKDVLDRMKKDARGRYMYEVNNKNLLPSAKEMQRLQILNAEFLLGHNNTLEQLSRLSDLSSGYKYYDKVYASAQERQLKSSQSQVGADENAEIQKPEESFVPVQPKTNQSLLNDDEIDDAYERQPMKAK